MVLVCLSFLGFLCSIVCFCFVFCVYRCGLFLFFAMVRFVLFVCSNYLVIFIAFVVFV